MKGQLAFEPQARPELEATVARLDIDFAKLVRPTAATYWSRIAKARVLDIARTVFGLNWASARSKYKKPALAEAMEAAFAAGDPPVGVSAAMHAKALAWVPPGFTAFDTGRTVGDPGDAATEAAGTAATPEPAEPAVELGARRTGCRPRHRSDGGWAGRQWSCDGARSRIGAVERRAGERRQRRH